MRSTNSLDVFEVHECLLCLLISNFALNLFNEPDGESDALHAISSSAAHTDYVVYTHI